MLRGAISIDIDTLATHFKGFGLQRDDYTYFDFQKGIANFLKLLSEFKLPATFFIVGKDLHHEPNCLTLKQAVADGHEIANHSMHHVQGFRYLTPAGKLKEIQEAAAIIHEKVQRKTVGFRAPGWNIDQETLNILNSQKYLYDSSIFPSFFNLPLKLLHYQAMKGRPLADRTTLGQYRNMFVSPHPYQIAKNQGIVELPITVTPLIRLPFFATFLLKTGYEMFKKSYQLIKLWQRPIIYEFHLFDFVDFSLSEIADQIPSRGIKGMYLPQSIHTTYRKKIDLFRHAIEFMIRDYKFTTLETFAHNYLNDV